MFVYNSCDFNKNVEGYLFVFSVNNAEFRYFRLFGGIINFNSYFFEFYVKFDWRDVMFKEGGFGNMFFLFFD